jgi:hypothetical protein
MPYFTDRWEPCLCGVKDCPRCFPERGRRRRAADRSPWRALWRTMPRAAVWDDEDAEEWNDDVTD